MSPALKRQSKSKSRRSRVVVAPACVAWAEIVGICHARTSASSVNVSERRRRGVMTLQILVPGTVNASRSGEVHYGFARQIRLRHSDGEGKVSRRSRGARRQAALEGDRGQRGREERDLDGDQDDPGLAE